MKQDDIISKQIINLLTTLDKLEIEKNFNGTREQKETLKQLMDELRENALKSN